MVMTMVTLAEFAMREIKASEFKAKCLKLMDEVQRTRRGYIVTKRGKPVADIVPHQARKATPFGVWKGRVKITGDIISPLDVEWDALK